MALSKPCDGVKFARDSLEKAFEKLDENSPLKKSIRKAIKNITQNVFAGENIPKNQIPKDYLQNYKINNLWWYPLADGWRLVYSVVTPSNVEILAVIMDYFDHKNYQRKFHY